MRKQHGYVVLVCFVSSSIFLVQSHVGSARSNPIRPQIRSDPQIRRSADPRRKPPTWTPVGSSASPTLTAQATPQAFGPVSGETQFGAPEKPEKPKETTSCSARLFAETRNNLKFSVGSNERFACLNMGSWLVSFWSNAKSGSL